MTTDNADLRLLPPLRHPAGPLDAMLWIGGDGLALAQFGTRGGLYQPEHANPNPSLAIVDAQHGTVLDTLAFNDTEPLKPHSPTAAHYAALRAVAAIRLPDGRVRVLLEVWQSQIPRWIVWTQGEPPRVLPYPYPDKIANSIALTPDGSRVLVVRRLTPKGGLCNRQGCAPGEPVEGVLVALHDLDTGHALWSRHARVTERHVFAAPAISPDGCHALIPQVPKAGTFRMRLGLVSMEDGRLIQKLPLSWSHPSAGFTREGRAVWTHGLRTTVMYEMRDDGHGDAPAARP